jgi:micrococcal nuclease
MPAGVDGPRGVVRVVDGDTVVIAPDTTVRLIGIDTPETVDPRKPVQCFGREASAYAHLLLDGRSVSLEYDPTQGRLDRYGRTLA